MRILAIRGSNLTSLEGPFALDLETGPLGDAGIFAISGPTGAGKSTLLDALCVALYNKTPRLGGQGGVEDVEDVLREGRHPEHEAVEQLEVCRLLQQQRPALGVRVGQVAQRLQGVRVGLRHDGRRRPAAGRGRLCISPLP